MCSDNRLEQVVVMLEHGLPPAPDAGFLGGDLPPELASLVVMPVPWEATASYGGGAAKAPSAIISASHQLDLEDSVFGRPYRAGIAFLPEDETLVALNVSSAGPAARVIDALERGGEGALELSIVNAASRELNESVHAVAVEWLDQGKFVGLVGGDHSCPEGLIRALARRQPDGFGILHFDAHHDLRRAYEGFTGSHASIMYNVMEHHPEVRKLVSVGIRDYSREERRYMEDLGERGVTFYSADVFRRRAKGEAFDRIADDIIEALPNRVYLSFDIDALDPSYCPNTGTPVPGGLSFDQACYLLEKLAGSGRRVIGFDLCEVAPGRDGDEWDANVGARMLYKLCGCLLRSQGKC